MKCDKRDLIIRRQTQAIADMLIFLKSDDTWKISPELSRTIRDANEAKWIGIQHCNQAGLSIRDEVTA